MASPAISIKDMLIDDGVGAVVASGNAWTIRVGQMTEDADEMLAVFDTPGAPPNPLWLLDFPTVQVMIRGAIDGYDAAWTKGRNVKDALLGRAPEVKNSDSFDAINGLGDLMFLRYDTKNRPLFSVNFNLIVEPATSGFATRTVL